MIKEKARTNRVFSFIIGSVVQILATDGYYSASTFATFFTLTELSR
jgi:hypothetical protein